MTTIIADPACRFNDSSSKSSICSVDDKPSVLLLDSDINKIVERKLRSTNFRVLHWSLDSLGETNGFLGQYYTLSVTVKIDDKSRHLKFFAKTPPPTDSPQYDFLVNSNTFNKEIAVYSDIMSKIGMGNGPKWAPDYYLGKSNAIIVLEDAKQEGYVTPDKFLLFDVDHCISVITTLSTFHSRFLIHDEKLRRTTGQTIMDLYGNWLEEVAFVEEELAARKYLCSCIKGACTMVDYAKRFNDEERSLMKDWITKTVRSLPILLQSSKKFRNVVCHRDIWPNNMMFKRDSNGKPIGCYLIDFQFLRHSPPALDFVLCLYLTTDRATRRRHFDRFIDVYCDTMKNELASEGLDMEECLPREQFIECCGEIRNVALAYSIANIQVMLLTKQAVEKYFVNNTELLENVVYGEQRSDLVINECRTLKAYKDRIVDMLEDIKDHLVNKATKC
ncbi:uncharacterized protein LOC114877505 [Osmia bicornis bicornis]|uniref:uncharacterized protein LOC114877505 n=1 Tax=Osmia bicornis bicornis TaxID=1437191 RepID=UPI0010F792B7|nr:uncharacterized protein LOC114877505 [Osmia bicornis bicornis]